MVPIVQFESLIDKPVDGTPYLSSPIVLPRVHGVVAADRRENPFAGELFRIVKFFSKCSVSIRRSYFAQQRKENVRSHLRVKPGFILGSPSPVEIAIVRRIPQ